MKYFLPLVQERGAKIPAPVWEVVAPAAAPPPPPYLSLVLHRMFDCESSCSAPKVLLPFRLWHHKFLQSFWQHLKSKNKTCSSGKPYPEAVMYLLNLSVYVALQSLDEKDAHSQKVILPQG